MTKYDRNLPKPKPETKKEDKMKKMRKDQEKRRKVGPVGDKKPSESGVFKEAQQLSLTIGKIYINVLQNSIENINKTLESIKNDVEQQTDEIKSIQNKVNQLDLAALQKDLTNFKEINITNIMKTYERLSMYMLVVTFCIMAIGWFMYDHLENISISLFFMSFLPFLALALLLLNSVKSRN